MKQPPRIRPITLAIALGLSLANTQVEAGFPAVVQLSSLDGGSGFRLDGVAADDGSGRSVSAAGDVNGDGIGDVIIGADGADPNGLSSGSSYVVFGRSAGFFASIDLSDLNGSNGFRLDGAASADFSGNSVSAAGDLNGDGIGDVIIGAPGANPNGIDSGSSYVVFGASAGFASSLQLSALNGSNGFRLDGVAAGDGSGRVVSATGDINGDGIADVVIGAFRADPNGLSSGSSYVVFGSSAGFFASIDLSDLNGSNGFRLDGAAAADGSGISVSAAGDINGDGIADVIIGAFRADPNGSQSGSSYVVFGTGTGFASSLALSALNGSNGFRLDGVMGDFSGISVSAAGDLNGDGIGDVIIGAYGAGPNGLFSGSSYVVFGTSAGFASSLQLNDLNGSDGFRLDGAAVRDYSGFSVSAAGDVNGDGIDDVIIGAGGADPNGSSSGSSYVVFGQASTGTTHDFDADTHADILWRHRTTGNNALWLMNGRTANKGPLNRVAQAAQRVQGVGDFDGDGKADIFWRNTAIGTNSIWLMNGRTASFGATQTVANLNFNVSGIGDFDGDGKDDVLWRDAVTGANSIWLMNGRTPGTGPVNATATSWSVGGIGDFDGDGKADILWRNSTDGRNSIWLMNGRTISFGATSQVANLNIVVSGIGDFDGDGKADILWRNTANGANPLWLMNGRTPGFGTTSTVANLNLKAVQVSDFDGDGKADILWRNLTTGANSLWLMNGRAASFWRHLAGSGSELGRGAVGCGEQSEPHQTQAMRFASSQPHPTLYMPVHGQRLHVENPCHPPTPSKNSHRKETQLSPLAPKTASRKCPTRKNRHLPTHRRDVLPFLRRRKFTTMIPAGGAIHSSAARGCPKGRQAQAVHPVTRCFSTVRRPRFPAWTQPWQKRYNNNSGGEYNENSNAGRQDQKHTACFLRTQRGDVYLGAQCTSFYRHAGIRARAAGCNDSHCGRYPIRDL